jgi:hypothetical protein
MGRALVLGSCLASGLACVGTEREPPGDFGGSPFWSDVRLSEGEDLGHAPRALDPAERRPPGDIRLVDVTGGAGLAGAISSGNPHGVGVAFVDLNSDGYADIFVANGAQVGGPRVPSMLYRNEGDGTFRDVTLEAGLGVLAAGNFFSVAAGDYDNDGDVDLYLGGERTDVLLESQGDGTFRDATADARAGGPPSEPDRFGDGRSKVVSFGDYDGDRFLDVVSASSALDPPFAYLLKNQGDGTFRDVTEETGVRAHEDGNPCAVLWVDHDNDADVDLWIWNDRGGHILLVNEGGRRFSDGTRTSDLDRIDITHPMGIDAADFDHDGDLDVYVSNIGDNPLLRNDGDGTFTDITQEAGTGGDFGWGLSFEDFDGDGWQDLFVAQEDDLPHLVFQNLGERPPRFRRIEFPHPPVLDGGRAHNVAAAFADYDHDGRVDIVVAETDGSRLTLYRNETDRGSHRWLDVLVDRAPGGGNAGAIGARIAVKTGDLVQFEDILGG